MANIKAYEALCRVSTQEQLPVCWKNDLYVVDKSTLTEGTDIPAIFGWVLRENGTFLDDPLAYVHERMNHSHDYRSIRRQVEYRYTQFGDRDTFQYYWYDESGLQRVSQEEYIRYLENEVLCMTKERIAQ